MTISSNVNVNVRQFHTYSNLHVNRKYLFKVCLEYVFNPTFVCFLFVSNKLMNTYSRCIHACLRACTYTALS